MTADAAATGEVALVVHADTPPGLTPTQLGRLVNAFQTVYLTLGVPGEPTPRLTITWLAYRDTLDALLGVTNTTTTVAETTVERMNHGVEHRATERLARARIALRAFLDTVDRGWYRSGTQREQVLREAVDYALVDATPNHPGSTPRTGPDPDFVDRIAQDHHHHLLRLLREDPDSAARDPGFWGEFVQDGWGFWLHETVPGYDFPLPEEWLASLPVLYGLEVLADARVSVEVVDAVAAAVSTPPE